MKQPPNSIVFHSKEIRKSKRSFLYDQLQHIYIVKEDTHFLINLHSGHGKTISRVITKIKIVHRSLLGIESKPSMFITFHKRASYSCFVPKDWKVPFGDDGLRYMLHEPQICSDCCCILCSVRVGSAHGGKSFMAYATAVKDGFICGKICCIDCSLRSYMVGTVGGTIGLDLKYYCRRRHDRTT